MLEYPSPEDWTYANKNQIARTKRSFEVLYSRAVPVYPGPLFIGDESDVVVRSPLEVARRTLVLWAVELRAESVPYDEIVTCLLDAHSLWPSVSPDEKQFLTNETADSEECRKLVWRLEGIWVLMWALGYLDELDWPSRTCDVSHLVNLANPYQVSSDFITEATLRPINELLDARDLTMRIHWAIRDAWLHRGSVIPQNLDWSSGGDNLVPVDQCAAVGERHYVLNWLTAEKESVEWDDVDTST